MKGKTVKVLLLMLYSSIQLSAQCINGNCYDGEGTFIYPDKSIYIGQFQGGKVNGKGTCYYSNGAKYKGDWLDHQYYGVGTYYFPNGKAEHGNWAYNKLVKRLQWEPPFQSRAALTWAIIIGVANYQHLKPLNYADDDAHRIAAFLQSPEGGGIPDHHIKILIDESATKSRIIQLLHETVEQVGINDRLVFFFSGHGFEDALAPIDIRENENKLYHKEVINMINSSVAEQGLCILDACFAEDSYTDNQDFKNAQKSDWEQYRATQKTAFIFSSSAKENSIEQKGLRQGIFSHFLLLGLRGAADTDKDGKVTIDEISLYVKEEVRTYTNNYQNPTVINAAGNQMPLSKVED